LPDGDIDLCIFSPDTSIKDNWATRLHAKLEEEEHSLHSPFKIGDVQVINAEVCVPVQSIGPSLAGGLYVRSYIHKTLHV